MLGFCQRMPKAELHAHLNGSISAETLQKLIKEQKCESSTISSTDQTIITKGKQRTLEEVFRMFPLIQALTNTPQALTMATVDVIREFSEDNVKYLELRSTPKNTEFMTKTQYIDSIISAINQTEYLDIICRLLLSIDRRQSIQEVEDTVDLAIKYKEQNSPVVGLDLSGDPLFDARPLIPLLRKAKNAGLKLTFHVAESPKMLSEVSDLLNLPPDRIGHGTLLENESIGEVLRRKTPLEICLTSNVKCATVKSYDNHHMKFWLEKQHPIAICTDDKGLFDTTLSEEYNLAAETFELEKRKVYEMSLKSLDYAFLQPEIVEQLKIKWLEFYISEFEK